MVLLLGGYYGVTNRELTTRKLLWSNLSVAMELLLGSYFRVTNRELTTGKLSYRVTKVLL